MYYFAARAPMQRRPAVATARIQGGPLAPNLQGMVRFAEAQGGGTWVQVVVEGLPPHKPATGEQKPVGPHGFHIHANGTCEVGDPAKPFEGAGGHWNPDNQPHGNHAGDFPVLFSNSGRAMMTFYTDRFRVADVVGKAIMIHENPDDYRSQLAGDAGRRLACGVIRAGELS